MVVNNELNICAAEIHKKFQEFVARDKVSVRARDCEEVTHPSNKNLSEF